MILILSMLNFMLKWRLYSTNSNPSEPLKRIGNSLLKIPEEYKNFFTKNLEKDDEIKDIYDPNLRLIIDPTSTTTSDQSNQIQLQGRPEIFQTLHRLKTLLKWGHFFWRLSNLSSLSLEPIRIIRPIPLEMKIYWQLKVKRGLRNNETFYIDGENVNLKNLLKVQLHRLKLPINYDQPAAAAAAANDKIIYSGLTRYIFDGESGFCREIRVERIEPKIEGIDWKWKMGKFKFSEA